MASDQRTINDALGAHNAALKTAAARAAVAPRVVPVVHRVCDDLNQLVALVPDARQQADGSQMQLLALLSALGEREASDRIAAMAASTGAGQSLAGKAHQLMVRFLLSDDSPASQQALADDLERIGRAHPDNVLLTQVTIEIAHEETFPEIGHQLLQFAGGTMKNPVAAALRERQDADAAAARRDAALANKPLVLSGTLIDGKPFSTDSLKGKVVLVDFWATWCGPCRAELPRVRAVYDQYHSKGLEVVGVSNDYDAAAVTAFVAGSNMPWPELFDRDAAAGHKFNSVTVGQKIDGIPVMYLIDRKGVLRTVNARGNMEELIPRLLAEPN